MVGKMCANWSGVITIPSARNLSTAAEMYAAFQVITIAATNCRQLA